MYLLTTIVITLYDKFVASFNAQHTLNNGFKLSVNALLSQQQPASSKPTMPIASGRFVISISRSVIAIQRRGNTRTSRSIDERRG
jgi:hypothetical protein